MLEPDVEIKQFLLNMFHRLECLFMKVKAGTKKMIKIKFGMKKFRDFVIWPYRPALDVWIKSMFVRSTVGLSIWLQQTEHFIVRQTDSCSSSVTEMARNIDNNVQKQRLYLFEALGGCSSSKFEYVSSSKKGIQFVVVHNTNKLID